MTYRHTDDMGEISGFGGVYETHCQDMLEAGCKWLDENKDANLEAKTVENVYGIFLPESDDAKALEGVIADASNGYATGAMMHAVMSRLFFIAGNGWDAYCAEIRKHEVEEK